MVGFHLIFSRDKDTLRCHRPSWIFVGYRYLLDIDICWIQISVGYIYLLDTYICWIHISVGYLYFTLKIFNIDNLLNLLNIHSVIQVEKMVVLRTMVGHCWIARREFHRVTYVTAH